jgi:hypothetical protein
MQALSYERARLLALALALLTSAAAAGEPPAAPANETASELADEAMLPEGATLDLSTPSAEELLAPGKLKPSKPFVRDPRAPVDAKVGVDYRKPALPALEFRPDDLLSGKLGEQSTGVAWATVTAGLPLGWDQASVDTRLDPAQEQGKLGTTLSRSLPLGDALSLTLQNGVAVSRSVANPAPGTVPAAAQSWSSSQAVRFNILPTGTAVSLGATVSSTDDKWLRTLSAEQKLFGGPLSVTGSVSETPTGEAATSVKAGFKRTW